MGFYQKSDQPRQQMLIEIKIQVPGTLEQARAIRDAVGSAISAEFMLPIIAEAGVKAGIEGHVDYSVHGYYLKK